MSTGEGRLLGIARKTEKYAPVAEVENATVSLAAGVEGDYRGGLQAADRRVTVLTTEAWRRVCDELGTELPWTMRRVNLLVEGLDLEETVGDRIEIGDVVLEVTMETAPCNRMDEQHRGLTDALRPDWRGGVCCRVVSGGTIGVGDSVRLATDT